MTQDEFVTVVKEMLKVHLKQAIKNRGSCKKFSDSDYQFRRFMAYRDVKWMHELMLSEMIDMALDGSFPDYSKDEYVIDALHEIYDNDDLHGNLEDLHKAMHEYFGLV